MDTTNDTRRCLIDGESYTLAEMMAANIADQDTCDWLRAAKPGDVRDDYHAERVECVAVASPPRSAAASATPRRTAASRTCSTRWTQPAHYLSGAKGREVRVTEAELLREFALVDDALDFSVETMARRSTRAQACRRTA